MADELSQPPEGGPSEIAPVDEHRSVPVSPAIPRAKDAQAADSEAPAPSPWATARRLVALAVVLVAVAGFFWARETDHLAACTTKVTRTSDRPPVVTREESCDPLPVDSLVPVLLAVLALMWPDLASVELFGLGSIARRVNKQDARQNHLEAAQQRLENRLEATVTATARQSQGIELNFGTNASLARLAETVAKGGGSGESAAETSTEESPQTSEPSKEALLSEFSVVVEPVTPWLEVARRLNSARFSAVLHDGADSGTPSDDSRFVNTDKELLRRVERPGQPFDVEALERWASENALQLDAVRDTVHAGSDASTESLRVATKFASQLRSDLERRGLVATT